MTRRIGVAILGPGKGADLHARALSGISDARLVAVWGRSPERTARFAAQYGATAYADPDALFAEARPEVAIVCTPHPLHADYVIRAAEAGLHVLVEKPMAVRVEDCDRMIVAAAVRRVHLGVMSQRRWYEPVRRVKAAVEGGRIGEPALVTVTVLGWRGPEYYAMDAWRGTWSGEGGGVIVNQASHQLDLLQWLAGPVREVTAFVGNLNHPEIEVEDSVVAALRLAGGGLGSVVASNSVRPGLYATIHIHGRSGASVGVQTDGGSMFVAGLPGDLEPPINDLWTIPGEEGLLEQWQHEDRARGRGIDVTTYYHALQLRDFFDAVREGRPPAVTGEDGRRTVELIAAIYRSHELRRAVALGDAGQTTDRRGVSAPDS